MSYGTGATAGSMRGPRAGSTADNAPLQDGDARYLDISPDGDARTSEVRQGDARTDPIKRGRDTWSTSLPRGIRESMRSGQRTRIPRAYEERLRKYFESLE